jgi:hypothetical protein
MEYKRDDYDYNVAMQDARRYGRTSSEHPTSHLNNKPIWCKSGDSETKYPLNVAIVCYATSRKVAG